MVPKLSSDNGALPTTLLQIGVSLHILYQVKSVQEKNHLKVVVYQKVLRGRLCVVLPSMVGEIMWSATPPPGWKCRVIFTC